MILYTISNCPHCKVMREIVTGYEEVSLDDRPEVVQGIAKKLGGCVVPLLFDENANRFMGLVYKEGQPQIVRIKSK